MHACTSTHFLGSWLFFLLIVLLIISHLEEVTVTMSDILYALHVWFHMVNIVMAVLLAAVLFHCVTYVIAIKIPPLETATEDL